MSLSPFDFRVILNIVQLLRTCLVIALLGITALAQAQTVSVSPSVTANGNFTIFYQNAPVLTTGENHIMESKNGAEWVSLGKVTGASGNLPITGRTAGNYKYKLRTVRCQYYAGQYGGGQYHCQPATYSAEVAAASIGISGTASYQSINASARSFTIKWTAGSGP